MHSFADRYEDELDAEGVEDDYLIDEGLDAAQLELGQGLSEEDRRGLHLYRMHVEHGRSVHIGKGAACTRMAVLEELARRVLQPKRPRRMHPPIGRAAMTGLVQ